MTRRTGAHYVQSSQIYVGKKSLNDTLGQVVGSHNIMENIYIQYKERFIVMC